MSLDLALLNNVGAHLFAHDLRRVLKAQLLSEGVVDGTHLDVTQRGAGINRSVDVAAGVCFVSDDQTLEGLYPFTNDAVVNLPINAADVTNPRIDIVIARVYDSEYSDVASGSDIKTLEVIAGTPAATPTVPATPTRSLKLAEVAVAAGATTIANGAITERRVWADGAKAPRGSRKNGNTNATTVASTTAVPIGGTTYTDVTEAARFYRYGITCRVSSSVAGDVATVRIQRDGTNLDVQADIDCTIANRRYHCTIWDYDTPTAGSHTYRTVVARGGGTGTVTVDANGKAIFEDIGEAVIT